MSYILDALRKAEAERRTGGTPDTLTAPVFSATQPDRRDGWRGSRWLWALAAAAAGALATAAWLEWKTPEPASVPATAAVAEPQPAPSTAPVPEPAPPPTASVTLHQPPPAAIETPLPAPQVEPPKRASSRVAPQPAEPQPQPQAAIATLRELPAEIQRQIPPLSISGYIYAANPADRSVLINRKLLREGDEIAPGLILEKLLPNGLVLNYKGYRYRSSY